MYGRLHYMDDILIYRNEYNDNPFASRVLTPPFFLKTKILFYEYSNIFYNYN